jgi:glycosyltransferase involved in cell wall biosynthesis
LSPIRVCQCIDDLEPHGAQQVVRLLAGALDPRRFQRFVYTFRDGPLRGPLERDGVSVRVLRRRIPKIDVSLLRRLRRQLIADRIDVLHMHLFGATLHGTLAASRMPRLATVVSLHSNRADNLPQRLIYPRLFRAADSVVGVSRDASREMSRRHRGLDGKLVTVLNGIDVDAFRRHPDLERLAASVGVPAGARIVGTVGRLSPEKGHFLLLDAFHEVTRHHADAFLLVVGRGDLGESLARRAADLGIANSVRLLGARDDVPDLLSLMHVFVLSSFWEGLPLVLLEAMAAGVPVVSTAVGGVPEVVDHERDGLVVPPSDPAALASAMCRILDDNALANRLRFAARTKVEAQFSVASMARQHARLYERLAYRPTSGRAAVSWLDDPDVRRSGRRLDTA